jgi:hypothetical protein
MPILAVLEIAQMVNGKMMLPTNVTHVTLPVINVTDQTMPTVLNVNSQDTTKTDIVLTHVPNQIPIHLIPQLQNVETVTLLVWDVLDHITTNVLPVHKVLTYMKECVSIHVQKDGSLTKTEPVSNVMDLVVLVTDQPITTVLNVVTHYSSSKECVMKDAQKVIGKTLKNKSVKPVTVLV